LSEEQILIDAKVALGRSLL